MKLTITIPIGSNILVVEDNQDRINWFHNKLIGTNLVVATSSTQALKELKSVSSDFFKLVFLDHDAVPAFIEPNDVGYTDKTFFLVAEYLGYAHYIGTVVIHSYNPVGVERMRRLFDIHRVYSVAVPFGTFELQVS